MDFIDWIFITVLIIILSAKLNTIDNKIDDLQCKSVIMEKNIR